MPSQTFLNLDKEKQKKLLDIAMKEFSKYSYPAVSINQIIQNAGISRGSFYMYFKDKDDLFEYLVEMNQNNLNQKTKEIIKKNQGDLYTSFIELYDVILKMIFENHYQGILKNFFVFFHLRKEKMEYPGHALYEYIKEDINIKKIASKDLEFVFNMFTHTLFLSIAEAIKTNHPLDVKEQYLRKLDIICYGIYKEEKEC